jgi:hypothetical protein
MTHDAGARDGRQGPAEKDRTAPGASRTGEACNGEGGPRRWPLHGRLGLVLVAVAWIMNWSMDGPRTHLLFFFLWLGYCLVIDALVCVRRGTSLLTRTPAGYAALFLCSIPVWWLFELINLRTGNWFYDGRALFTDFQYALFASLSFSTVIPAVFGTAELAATFGWLRRVRPGVRICPARHVLVSFFAAGWLMLALLLLWPRYFFPFVWLSVFFIIEPVNAGLKNRSLLAETARGDWRPVLALFTGCLICGFFWEMWNYHSFPKWHYRVPFVDFLRIFEMPVLGYGGYLPFSLELFAVYQLMAGFLKHGKNGAFVCDLRIDPGIIGAPSRGEFEKGSRL